MQKVVWLKIRLKSSRTDLVLCFFVYWCFFSHEWTRTIT